MKKSLRRVSNALLGVGVSLVFMGVLMTTVGNCSTGSCLTANVLFGLPENQNTIPELVFSADTGASTQLMSAKPGTFTLINQVVDELGVSLIFIAMTILIALELIELHYIRRFLGQKIVTR